MEENIKYEVTGGIVITPEMGNVEIPPESTVRKDIEKNGELIIKAESTSREVNTAIKTAKRNGITEIPAGKLTQRDEGR